MLMLSSTPAQPTSSSCLQQFSVRSSHEDIPVAGTKPLLGTARDAPAEAAADWLGRVHALCIVHDGITIRFEGD